MEHTTLEGIFNNARENKIREKLVNALVSPGISLEEAQTFAHNIHVFTEEESRPENFFKSFERLLQGRGTKHIVLTRPGKDSHK